MEEQNLHWRDERRGEYALDGRVMLVRWLAILLVLMAVNVFLVGGILRLTHYGYDSAEAVLADYPDYTLLDSHAEEDLHAWLLEKDGKAIVLTTEKHFLFDSWRLVSELPAEPYPPTIQCHNYSLTLTIGEEGIVFFSLLKLGFRNQTLTLGADIMIPLLVMGWAFGLLALEAAMFFGLKKLRSM